MVVLAERIGDAGLMHINGAAGGRTDIGLRDVLSFRHVASTGHTVAAELRDALRAARPAVVSVDLGFDLAVKGSEVLAQVVDAGRQASIKVHLEWDNSARASSTGIPESHSAGEIPAPTGS